MNAERWQKIEELYHQALDCPTADRQAFLDQACIDDASLKIEVSTLLASHEKAAAGFLDAPALQVAAANAETETATLKQKLYDDELSSSNQFIGNYELIQEIGRGGMGAVYLARRADDEYRKQVAIKLIRNRPGFAENDDIIRRFRNERQILAGLEHPNIAHFLEGGATSEGHPYYVMENIRGQRIDHYCDAHHLPVNERLKLFRDVCSAVQYAHQRLIIHRDIKPSNILVTDEGTVKLLDFGIAKLLDEEMMDRTVETRTSDRLMTPEYASPEQIQGKQVTTATDVYSLGVVLYELLCGRRPYRFEHRSWEEIERVVCREEPVRPSAALTELGTSAQSEKTTRPISPETSEQSRGETVDSLRRQLANDLDNIVMMALRKEPERRYATVEQLSEDIRRYLEGLPILARPNTIKYRAEKFIRRNKAAVAGATLIVLTLVAATGITAWQAQIARRERDKAERRFNEVRKLANAVLFKYHDGIETLAGSTAIREVMVRDALEYLDNLSKESAGDRSLQRELASAYEKVGGVQGSPFKASFGDYPAALVSQRKGLAIREALLAADPQNQDLNGEVFRSYNYIGDLLRVTGASAESLDYYRKAQVRLESMAAADPGSARIKRDLALVYTRIGRALTLSNDRDGALENYRKSLTISEELFAAKPRDNEIRRDLGLALMTVGDGLDEKGSLPEALEFRRKALSVMEPLAAEVPDNAQYRRDVGVILQRRADTRLKAGDHRGALEDNRRGLAIDEALAARDPLNAQARRDLVADHQKIGKVLLGMGDPAGALIEQQKGLEIAAALAAANASNAEALADLSNSHYKIGDVKLAKNDLHGALESYRRSLAIDEKLSAADPANSDARYTVAESYASIAALELKVGDAPAALAGYRKALEIYEALAATDRNDESVRHQAVMHETIGDILAKAGDKSEGRKHYQQSLDLWRGLQTRNALTPEEIKKPTELAQKLGPN
jgi:eukaryotic-like serine/threonine-protein kinase